MEQHLVSLIKFLVIAVVMIIQLSDSVLSRSETVLMKTRSYSTEAAEIPPILHINSMMESHGQKEGGSREPLKARTASMSAGRVLDGKLAAHNDDKEVVFH
ncbi:unnamed protein product [Tilletia controversa]|uniref:Uncharacterized protein n=3 Tax=Tilletia TaxID=13289 RepID=A0A8X7SY38_9BASI|nr:hypothetical protein A4X06_0g3489 [Tilletia controversa]KAE8261302.1 hypothetical protein A4X03_0g3373 [Tilletia caries]CAD6921373.1 unnamed protein product [Tilletia laevis]CAD6902595.1 unnamed protein product [Tilletia controversa]CAD6911478.1 unnamed protein product [Tilletia controversa]